MLQPSPVQTTCPDVPLHSMFTSRSVKVRTHSGALAKAVSPMRIQSRPAIDAVAR
jgi:hypothetical protein